MNDGRSSHFVAQLDGAQIALDRLAAFIQRVEAFASPDDVSDAMVREAFDALDGVRAAVGAEVTA